AWIWPGLGHLSMGHRRRGMLIMFGVLFLFVGGVLIGGVDCVDRKQDFLWFLAQSVCGPIAFAVDLINQLFVKRMSDEARLFTIGLNKPNEMGTLFGALAGLMNLVVILDALQGAPHADPPQLDERRRQPPAVQSSAIGTSPPGSDAPLLRERTGSEAASDWTGRDRADGGSP
ncbi:MAG: hypothetical protein L0219_06230, partial [Phycisphaerales bacterium]|nr:hypothetical protein [Phycisphaerales bacterium]